MNRRSFLGSVIGMVAGVPFVAKHPGVIYTPKFDKVAKLKNVVSIFDEDPRILRLYQIVATLGGDPTYLLMPQTEEVELDRENLYLKFSSRKLQITEQIQVDTLGLINNKGQLLFTKELPSTCVMERGDSWTCTYEARFTGVSL